MSGAVANFCGFDGEAPKGGGAGGDYKFSPPYAFGPAPPRATVDPNFRGVQAPYGRECDDQPAARRRKQHKPFCAPYGRDCDGNFVDEADHSVKTKLHEDAPTACWGDKLKDCSGARKTWGALKAKNEGGNTRPWKTDSEMAAERAQAERDLAGAGGRVRVFRGRPSRPPRTAARWPPRRAARSTRTGTTRRASSGPTRPWARRGSRRTTRRSS